jgi:hypothetical protein
MKGVTMILPPLSDDCNARFPTIGNPNFDDHYARREHYLQQRLKQYAPVTLDGGRAMLWFCRLCLKPWYELGRTASFVCLSKSQLAKVAQQLGAEVRTTSSLPVSICPLCAALHLGGMPRIEEYPDKQGYRLAWEAIMSRYTRLFCIVYKWNTSSISDLLREACSTHCDVMTSPMEQVQSVLAWLKTLAEPGKEEIALLTESVHDRMNRRDPPQPGFSWCGYAWKARCPALGEVLVAFGMTFPTSSICSPSLLVACWRQIAREIEEVLAC